MEEKVETTKKPTVKALTAENEGLKKEIESLKEELNKTKDSWLRCAADFEKTVDTLVGGVGGGISVGLIPVSRFGVLMTVEPFDKGAHYRRRVVLGTDFLISCDNLGVLGGKLVSDRIGFVGYMSVARLKAAQIRKEALLAVEVFRIGIRNQHGVYCADGGLSHFTGERR